jgi:hypothetical protein
MSDHEHVHSFYIQEWCFLFALTADVLTSALTSAAIDAFVHLSILYMLIHTCYVVCRICIAAIYCCYVYLTPPINLLASGATPLNSACEKSKPGFCSFH